jgi:outer membrane protein OmpA-like peptidoglycan-associated protein
LDETARSELGGIAELLQQLPGETVYLHGHSDIQGEASVNKKIALQRAIQVRDYLISAGFDSSRFVAISWGTKRPAASNETEQGRAENRRVELSLSDK